MVPRDISPCVCGHWHTDHREDGYGLPGGGPCRRCVCHDYEQGKGGQYYGRRRILAAMKSGVSS